MSEAYDVLMVEVGHMSKRTSTAVFDFVDELRAEIKRLREALVEIKLHSVCCDARHTATAALSNIPDEEIAPRE